MMTDTFHFEIEVNGEADAPVIIGAAPNGRDTPPIENHRSEAYIGETEKNALGSDGELVQAVSEKVYPTRTDDSFGADLIVYDM
jgi:hypothetical protein